MTSPLLPPADAPRFTAFVVVKLPGKRTRVRHEYPSLHSAMRAKGRVLEFCVRWLEATADDASAAGGYVVRAGVERAADQTPYPA